MTGTYSWEFSSYKTQAVSGIQIGNVAIPSNYTNASNAANATGSMVVNGGSAQNTWSFNSLAFGTVYTDSNSKPTSQYFKNITPVGSNSNEIAFNTNVGGVILP